MNADVPDSVRQQVAERAYHVCEYCLIAAADCFWGGEVDHVISRKHGGPSTPENLAWSCACCNRNKGTDIATVVGQPQRLVRLFHPRSDRWLEAFVLQAAIFDPLTDIGLATVNLLKLNEDIRLKERRELERAGRYPTIEALARMKE
jgi:hypothetical protein